ncbi:MAG: PhoH family protein [Thermoprotei archaeon]|nr:MAG: PhoH family protein [Thermoprotei archaeon]RLF20123.1 MAG: PhoH family protein [Thermoprotei archaeon]
MVSLLNKIRPASEGQRKVVEYLTNDNIEIVGIFGPTGTGKSLLSCAYGIGGVMDGKYESFILIRPIVDITSGKELTAVDLGSLYYELASAYLRDILGNLISMDEIKKLIDKGKLVIADTHFLRGRTFDNSVIFLDDAQNIPPESASEVLMRIGHNSKFIIAGDPVFQKDVALEHDGATLLREALLHEAKAKVVDLGLKDVVRPGALRGIRLLLEIRMRKRALNDVEQKVLDSIREHAPDADVLTVVSLSEEKEAFEIKSEHVPDIVVISKTGYLGRVIGRGGERIQAVEKDVGLRIRAIELTLDFKTLIEAIHPCPWSVDYVEDIDLAGPTLQVSVRRRGLGPFVGQRAMYVKFIDAIFKKLIGIGVRFTVVEERKR